MKYPAAWDEFFESDAYAKIANILECEGWKFALTLQSGVVTVEPKRTDSPRNIQVIDK